MNWIKGLDRIILSTSFIVFIVVSFFVYPTTEHMPRLADINPEYEEWYKKHGKQYDIEISGKIDFESIENNIPPEKYLPLKIHRRITATGMIALISSGIWVIGLAGMTRLIKATSKWITKGFRE